MAKSKRAKRYYRPKSKWAANITRVENQTLTANTGEFHGEITLASNPVQLNTTVSQIFTVKNVEFFFDFGTPIESGQRLIEGITAYIMFVPQGMAIGNDYAEKHPEYIMAMRYYGGPQPEIDTINAYSNMRNPLRIKTRLARKLNTGDSIILYIQGYNQSTNSLDIDINGVLRWWTKAN